MFVSEGGLAKFASLKGIVGYTLSDEGITKRHISQALLLNSLFTEGEKGNSRKRILEGSAKKNHLINSGVRILNGMAPSLNVPYEVNFKL